GEGVPRRARSRDVPAVPESAGAPAPRSAAVDERGLLGFLLQQRPRERRHAAARAHRLSRARHLTALEGRRPLVKKSRASRAQHARKVDRGSVTKPRPAPAGAATPSLIRSRVPAWLLGALLVLMTTVLYWPATGNDFTNFDDNKHVLENAHVNSGLTWANAQ